MCVLHWCAEAFGRDDFEFFCCLVDIGDDGKDCVGAFGEVDHLEGDSIDGGRFGGFVVFVCARE